MTYYSIYIQEIFLSPLTRAEAAVHANVWLIKSLGNPSDAMANIGGKWWLTFYKFSYGITRFCTTALGSKTNHRFACTTAWVLVRGASENFFLLSIMIKHSTVGIIVQHHFFVWNHSTIFFLDFLQFCHFLRWILVACFQIQWFQSLFRCRIATLNFSMGFNIKGTTINPFSIFPPPPPQDQ